MKTTLDLSDNLLRRAKALARKNKTSLRSLTEAGLTRVLEEAENRKPATVRPVTFKGKGLSPEFADAGWRRIREAAYGDR